MMNDEGIVFPMALYTLDALKRQTGIGEAAFRAARRAGLCVHRKHGRAFVLGSDWIAYVQDEVKQTLNGAVKVDCKQER